MKLHARELLESVTVTSWLESGWTGDGVVSNLPEEGRLGVFSTTSLVPGSARPDCSPEKPVASGWLAGRCRWIPWRLREERWFFTSLFLMGLMAAPVALWRA